VEQLQLLSVTDDNQVVRIHCLGAVKATVKSLEEITAGQEKQQ